MGLKTSVTSVTSSLSTFRNAASRTASSLGRLQQSSGTATGAVARIKSSVAQVDPALTKMKGGTDRLSSALDKLRSSATQNRSGLNSMKTSVGQADGAFGKAKGGSDRLKSSLDRLKSAAGGAQKALRDVKNQSDAVERSVGKAGKSADRTNKGMGGLSKGLKGASTAQRGLNLVMAGSPFGLIMTLLAPLIARFVDMDKIVAVAKRGMESAWKAIRSATSSAMNYITPILKGVVNLYTAPIRGLITAMNGAIGGLNQIKVNIPDWVPVWGGKSFGLSLPRIPNIPALAQGGIVRPRSGGRLALLAEAGEAEAVIPLSKLDRMFGRGGPASAASLQRLAQAVERLAERPVHVQVDSQTIARAVLVGQRQLARR